MNKNDLTYILMCSSSQLIQRLWKPVIGGYCYNKVKAEVILLAEKCSKKGNIWLPTEFQLQKIGVKYAILNWMKFDQECSRYWNYFSKMYNEHPTKKMCGLAVIMAIAENKYWRDGSWK